MTGLKNNLLIHAVPGARSGFISAWLNNDLIRPAFDVGPATGNQFTKTHWCIEQPQANQGIFSLTKNQIENSGCTTIKINFNKQDLSTIGVLFLRKNAFVQEPDLSRDEYSLEVYTKVVENLKLCIAYEESAPLVNYDYVIQFRDTYNIDYLIDIYQKINNCNPSDLIIEAAIKTNQLNNIVLDQNHACSIAQLVINLEAEKNLHESNRFWSIVNVYNTTPIDQLHDTVSKLICPENYGVLLK